MSEAAGVGEGDKFGRGVGGGRVIGRVIGRVT